jgi:hypothetical protein
VIYVTHAHKYLCERCFQDKITGAGSRKIVGATVLIRPDSVVIEGIDEKGEMVRLIVATSTCWRGIGERATFIGAVLVEKADGECEHKCIGV